MKCLILIALAAMLIGMSGANASQSCPTFAEARHEHPNEYLAWHGEHCWYAGDASRLRRNRSQNLRSSISKAVPAVPLPRSKPFVLLLEQTSAEPSFSDRWPTFKSIFRWTRIEP